MTETVDAPLNVPTSGVREALGEVRDLDDGKREALVSIPWEIIDSYNSDFSRDCFDDYLGVRMPVVCWQHDKREPIGRASSWQKGQRANEFRLRFSDFDAVPRARQAYAQMRDGDITDVSFYYDQAKAVRHPSVRSAIRFVKGRMPEISPVTVGSIPGAGVVGVRQAADAAGVAELVRTGVISEAEGRGMLGMSGDVPTVGERKPAERESITLTQAGARSFTITIGDEGTATSTDGGATDAGDSSNVADLASAIDGAVDAAIAYLSQVDLSALPSEVGMVYQLLQAADVACDELMDAVGVANYDEPDAGDRGAVGDGDAPNADGAQGERGDVEYADPGYQDDKKKRYPIDTEEHVRAALSYIGQACNAGRYSDENLTKVKANIDAAAKKFGIDVSDDKGKRAADDVDVETQAALARMNLGRR